MRELGAEGVREEERWRKVEREDGRRGRKKGDKREEWKREYEGKEDRDIEKMKDEEW